MIGIGQVGQVGLYNKSFFFDDDVAMIKSCHDEIMHAEVRSEQDPSLV